MRRKRGNLIAEIDWKPRDFSCTSLCVLVLLLSNMGRIRAKHVEKRTKTSFQETPTTKSFTNKQWMEPTPSPVVPQSIKSKPTTKQLSSAFKDIMKTYDKKFRPDYGEKPLTIELSFNILSFGHIREVEMEYEVDLYFLQVWQDNRFNASNINHENATIELVGSDIESIWVPDTIFINSKKSNFHHVTLENRFMTVNLSNGEIVYHARITMTGACHMNLRYYPFDEQVCYIAMESYGHDELDLRYEWFTRGCNESCEQVFIYEKNLANFDITKAVKTKEKTTYHTPKFSSATGKFVFKRRTPYFLLQIYLPCVLIVMVSWASFWIHEEAVPARAAICVTTILTIITMLGVVNVNMPKVSYVKAVDFYLFVSFLMVFLSLVEYIIVLNIEFICRARKRRKENKGYSKKDKKHSVVVMVDTDEYQNGEYGHCNGHVENNTIQRKRPHYNGRRPSLFSFKINNNKNRKCSTEHMTKENQEMLLEELLRLKEPSVVDVVSRFLFPLVFVIFNLCYWLVYLDQSNNKVKIE